MGQCNVSIEYRGQAATEVPLIVVQGAGPTLLGRNWLQHNWQEIHHVRSESLQSVLDKYSTVFQEGLGTLEGFEAKIHVDPDARPRYFRHRSVPYAMRDKVEAELERLQAEGTLEPVDVSDWAAPIVPVVKSDRKSVRICGDFRITVNPVSKLDDYPTPKIEDLFARIQGGETFTKIDLSQAYQQLPLDEESKKYCVINTHKGLFRYTRLPFGVSSSGGIFQRVMDGLMQGIPGVVCYTDDILITGPTNEDHLKSLEEVLKQLTKAGLRACLKKCKFIQPSVEYLGYKIDKHGLHPLPDRVEAIHNAPAPQNISELKSYLGLLTYYGKFLPNLSTVLFSLYRLLRKDVPWRWTEEEEDTEFRQSKELLTSPSLLAHYDSMLPLSLACDASAYGIGAVLAHVGSDGTERPLGYVSQTLTRAKRNYSQLQKERLSCVFGVKKFHNYLFGRSFELITDHKPLLGLLKEDKPVSVHASPRVKRWALFLGAYEYQLTFRDTKAHANADALSRLPLPIEPATTEVPPELVLLARHLRDSPVTAGDIRNWTAKDRVLAQVSQFVLQGWPSTKCGADLEVYTAKQSQLSMYEGCILWGSRVVIPPQGRDAVLQELHEGHPGMSKMKSLARMYVWLPGIDDDVERCVRQCDRCQQVQSSPPPAPLHPWSWPTRPWARLHIDYAGPFEGKMLLVVVDAHSEWIEVFPSTNATSSTVISCLRPLFARFGIPETIVSDNGSCFVSEEFEHFLGANGIKHYTSAPYHPSSNGLAERVVQIVKRGLRKESEGDLNLRLSKTLLNYLLAPQSTTGVSPSELLLGRRIRTRLDLLKPHTADRVERRQSQQKAQHDTRARPRKFELGETVFVKNFGPGQKWLPGKVVEMTGPVSYRVEMEDGRERRCHQDQVRIRVTAQGIPTNSEEKEPVSVDDDANIQ